LYLVGRASEIYQRPRTETHEPARSGVADC